MKVQFNGEALQIQETTLAALLVREKLDQRSGIAVAVNSRVISRSQWENHPLEENDSIMVITATAGG